MQSVKEYISSKLRKSPTIGADGELNGKSYSSGNNRILQKSDSPTILDIVSQNSHQGPSDQVKITHSDVMARSVERKDDEFLQIIPEQRPMKKKKKKKRVQAEQAYMKVRSQVESAESSRDSLNRTQKIDLHKEEPKEKEKKMQPIKVVINQVEDHDFTIVKKQESQEFNVPIFSTKHSSSSVHQEEGKMNLLQSVSRSFINETNLITDNVLVTQDVANIELTPVHMQNELNGFPNYTALKDKPMQNLYEPYQQLSRLSNSTLLTNVMSVADAKQIILPPINSPHSSVIDINQDMTIRNAKKMEQGFLSHQSDVLKLGSPCATKDNELSGFSKASLKKHFGVYHADHEDDIQALITNKRGQLAVFHETFLARKMQSPMGLHSFQTTILEGEEDKVVRRKSKIVQKVTKEPSFQLRDFLIQRRLNQEELDTTVKVKKNMNVWKDEDPKPLPSINLQPLDFKTILLHYLSNGDFTEVYKLFNSGHESKIIRDCGQLTFKIPLPYIQAKEARNLTPLYLTVATGQEDILRLLFNELSGIDVDEGLILMKRSLNNSIDRSSTVLSGKRSIKKRSPLQLANALGLYKIVEALLEAGAKPNGHSKYDYQAEASSYYPPILIALKKKFRLPIVQELIGIKYKQTYDKQRDLDFEQCLRSLLTHGADPNQSLYFLTPDKPLPIFHALKNLQAVQLLIQYGGQVNVLNKAHYTPLCLLTQKLAVSSQKPIKNAEEIVKEIAIIGKARLSHCCKHNPLFLLLQAHQYDLFKFLLKYGYEPDVNWKGPLDECSPIQLISQQNSFHLYYDLLNHNQLNVQNQKQWMLLEDERGYINQNDIQKQREGEEMLIQENARKDQMMRRLRANYVQNQVGIN